MKKIITLILATMLLVLPLVSCGETADAVKLIDIDLTEEEYAFGVDKNQPELLSQVNAIIAEIQTNGKFDEICNKYFGDGTPTPVTSAEPNKNKDQLVVATNAAFAPFEYKEGDKYLGVDMEIAKLIADELGMELVIMNMDFDAVVLSVGQQKCDIAMAGLTVREDRKEHVNFTSTYYIASQKLIVKADDTTFDACQSTDDVVAILNGLDNNTKIGVQTGTTGQFYVEGDEDYGYDGYAVTCKGYDNGTLAVTDMINGNLDYVIIDAAPAAYIVEAFNK